MIKYYKKVFYLFFSVLILFANACEDDPLLEPESDTVEDGGSYGMLQLNEEDDHSQEEINPEIY